MMENFIEHKSVYFYKESALIEAGAQIETDAQIGARARIEAGARIGAGDIYITLLGYCEGYSKTLVNKNGVAWVYAGCQSFSLLDAEKHWSGKNDRRLTYALITVAKQIATEKGLLLS